MCGRTRTGCSGRAQRKSWTSIKAAAFPTAKDRIRSILFACWAAAWFAACAALPANGSKDGRSPATILVFWNSKTARRQLSCTTATVTFSPRSSCPGADRTAATRKSSERRSANHCWMARAMKMPTKMRCASVARRKERSATAAKLSLGYPMTSVYLSRLAKKAISANRNMACSFTATRGPRTCPCSGAADHPGAGS